MAAKRRTWPWVIVFVTVGLVGLFYVGGGWFFSSQVYDDALRAEPYDPSGLGRGTVQAAEIKGQGGSITLLPDEEDRDDRTFDDSVVGLAIGESLVVAGPATVAADGSQVREVRQVVGDAPAPGAGYGLTRDVWLTPEQAGLEADDVTVTTLDGRDFPAWLVRSAGSTKWAILTHGKGAARSEMLRMARPLHAAGYNVLIITYTNDVGAPASADGMVHYGREEWRDLEGAVSYALDNSATQIVLGGDSHGGAVTLGLLARGTLAHEISGVILDAPASSLRDVIDEAAEFRSLPVIGAPIPESLEDVALWMVAFRYGVNFSAVDYTGMKGLVKVPLLTFQGTADRTVPRAVNDKFMSDGSGSDGQYVLTEGAGHVLSWNVDPTAYEKQITAFVRSLD